VKQLQLAAGQWISNKKGQSDKTETSE